MGFHVSLLYEDFQFGRSENLSTLTSFNTAQISLDILASLREPLNYNLMA